MAKKSSPIGTGIVKSRTNANLDAHEIGYDGLDSVAQCALPPASCDLRRSRPGGEAGIGGNQVVGPPEYSAEKPFAGGPSASHRLERDVLSLSGVAAVVWLEGINDFSNNAHATVEAVEAGMKDVTARIRAKFPKARVIGATVTSALGSTNAAHGSAVEDEKRKALNEFIRHSRVFDGVADFDRATPDPQTGGLRAEFIPDSTTGGPGDKLHPNRAGYLARGWRSI